MLINLFCVQRNGRVFYPTGYGADPTGVQDSAPAIFAALDDAAKLQTGLELLPGINNLGGVVIDLKGGSFTISSPITFPPGIGNIVVCYRQFINIHLWKFLRYY